MGALIVAVMALGILVIIQYAEAKRLNKKLDEAESKMQKLEAMILVNSKALQSTMKVVRHNIEQEIKREEDAQKSDTKEEQ